MPDIGTASAQAGDMPPRTVSSGLSLWLELEKPSRMGELLQFLEAEQAAIQQALRSLHYVHFSRFLPTFGWDADPPPAVAALQVITEFDGDLKSYVLDFAMVIGEQFEHILRYVKDKPPSPIKDHPAAFLEFIEKHNVGYVSGSAGSVLVQSAYPDLTVIDIIGNGGLLPQADEPALMAVDRSDVQVNVLQGLNMAHGTHLGLKFTVADGARAFLAGLLDGRDGLPRVGTGIRWAQDARPDYALTVGLTFKGLMALGISAADEAAFGLSFPAFKVGPELPKSARLNGDVGTSAPINWQLGGARKAVLLVVSVYADDADELSRQLAALRQGLARHGLTEVVAWPVDALSGPEGAAERHVHFGYQDGLSQPRLAILGEPGGAPDMQPQASVGEFLLGSNYRNVYGGVNSLGGLSPALAENATFCALRIMAQDVAGFERLLDEASASHCVSREWLAAKLMGRWRNGTPLSQSPNDAAPDDNPAQRNAFDFAPSQAHPGTLDDADGLRCPVGAHIRRLNPRSAVVAGKPYSRRLLRRGMPYGPAYAGAEDSPAPARGLVGLFMCADLDRQFEFMLRQWAQGDQATSGVRAEQDPIIGAQRDPLQGSPMRHSFRIPRGGGQADIVLDMPRLVSTVGSAYLFMPGLASLARLSQPVARAADAVAFALHAGSISAGALSALVAATDGGGFTVGAGLAALPAFDPTDIDFRDDPFAVYAAYRAQAPVRRFMFGAKGIVWVFDDAHVAQVAGNGGRYHKQQVDQHQTAALLNMDLPWHDDCRAALMPMFQQALAGVRQQLPGVLQARLTACQAVPQPVDWAAEFAGPVARTLFFKLFGVDDQAADPLMAAADEALAMASPNEDGALDAALQAVYKELQPHKKHAPAGSLLRLILDMGGLLTPPFDPDNKLSLVERYANATVMVLVGVLPAKWALALATWHLLEGGGAALKVLRDDPSISDRAAAEELLRFDPSTPMSKRYATEDHVLGGVAITRGDRLMLGWASANRDSTRFGVNADRLDFRRNCGAGWSFGSGNAFECLGKELVLLMMSALVHALRAADPVPRLDPGFAPEWDNGPMFRALLQLPVQCH